MRYALAGALVGVALGAGPALAHPHVWITARAEVAYAANGQVTGVRHAWTFDEAYSAYVTQGLDKNNDGKLTPDELADLAKVNTESLAEFDYFTIVKAGGVKQAFAGTAEPSMTFEEGKATLRFLLPLKAPVSPKLVSLEVYDPTFFVSFNLADGDDAVKLAGAPRGCAATITRPKPIDAAQGQRLSEGFFEALTAASSFGAQFSNRALIVCP
ncbi:DUF1007 family protein [Salinarimonas soli]|uniref:DUF1007 family protein n=1 Tax=Salinarimonas soli TaxID=1638099 RepID=A0A5B2VG82_9HYPH|nr:DUF1007 family protein [Salinarimonas soli]KAA2237392.1 DUF1007 family protein [Salinarimonas soli]